MVQCILGWGFVVFWDEGGMEPLGGWSYFCTVCVSNGGMRQV